MLERNPRLRNLAARKQLLVIESELNRHLLVEDGRAMKRAVHDFGERTMQWRGIVTAGLAAFSAFRSRPKTPPTEKRSWFGPVLDTVRLGASLWSSFRNGKGRQ